MVTRLQLGEDASFSYPSKSGSRSISLGSTADSVNRCSLMVLDDCHSRASGIEIRGRARLHVHRSGGWRSPQCRPAQRLCNVRSIRFLFFWPKNLVHDQVLALAWPVPDWPQEIHIDNVNTASYLPPAKEETPMLDEKLQQLRSAIDSQ